MDGAHAFLVVLLVLDSVQAGLAGAAVAQGLGRRGKGEHAVARYSFRHAGVLLLGAALLAVPIVLGLVGALAARTAVWIVVGTELVGVLAARLAVERLHRAAHG